MANSAAGKPNIVVIWSDDIGIANLSCYSDGLMGYHTPRMFGRETARRCSKTDDFGSFATALGAEAKVVALAARVRTPHVLAKISERPFEYRKWVKPFGANRA